MKVLLLNGSAKTKGNTNAALEEMAAVLAEEEIETEIFHLAGGVIRDCIGCNRCTNGEINIAQSLFFSIIFVQSFYFDQIVHTVSFLR